MTFELLRVCIVAVVIYYHMGVEVVTCYGTDNLYS